MHPFLILIAVVGGILWLRLHAFLALLPGALAVAALTPPEAEGLRTLTPMAALMGLAGPAVTMAAAWLIPIV